MAQSYGFFNALQSDGVYDRLYNAEDYSSNMGAIISSGVRRSGNNDLLVSANGLQIQVAAGRAWIEGHWYYNDSILTLATATPPVGTLSRVDGVFLHLDTSVNVRSIQLIYRQGTPAATPAAPQPIRSGNVYEIQLASVTVAPEATTVTVTDTRANQNVCGWVTSPVGYGDYFANLDAEFEEWFTETKDQVASVTLFKQYVWSTTTTTSTTAVTFNIPQYDSTGTDIIQVYTNGLLELQGTDYTLSGSTITFAKAKQSGTEIAVICYKSIDGTGLGSVSDEITALQNQVAALGDINDFYYFCNGSTDNVQLSTLVQNFLNGSTSDNKKMKIHVCGTFGATAPAAGSGTTSSRYRWFNFAPSANTNRQITLDFYNCSPVNIQPANDTYNVIFQGSNYNIDGLTLTAGSSALSSLCIYGCLGGAVNAPISFSDCNISITGAYSGGTMYFTSFGTFNNCKIVLINQLNAACVFNATTDSLLQITGGKYYAYTGLQSSWAAGLYSSQSSNNAAITMFGANFPSTAKQSLYQTNAVRFNNGYLTACGTITQLPVTTASAATAYIYGTLPLDKD